MPAEGVHPVVRGRKVYSELAKELPERDLLLISQLQSAAEQTSVNVCLLSLMETHTHLSSSNVYCRLVTPSRELQRMR